MPPPTPCTLRFLFASRPLYLSRLLTSSPSSCAVGRSARGGFFTHRRDKSAAASPPPPRRKEEEMEVKDRFAYNEKRAKGDDKGNKGRAMELKARKLNPVSTTCYLQIMGTGMDTQDTSPSILLFFDRQRFIFNAGEGLQRYCSEHKIKLSKMDHIFLTRVCSETVGGLPSLVLTLAGIGEEGMSVNIWGPSDLDFLLGATRSFIPRKSMLHAHSFGLDHANNATPSSPRAKNDSSTDATVLIDDEVVRISAMFVRPTNQKIGSDSDLGEFLRPGDTAVVYACELLEIKDKFDPVKAKSRGLKPGLKYRDLQLGKSVKSDFQDIMQDEAEARTQSFCYDECSLNLII